MDRYLFSSVTRIADVSTRPFELVPTERKTWRSGDYICGRVADTHGRLHSIELPSGRMAEAMEGDRVIGALGVRAATLEAVGSWQDIDGEDFEAMTPAGLFGKVTSISPFLAPLMRLHYQGHVARAGGTLNMCDFLPPVRGAGQSIPIVLIIGTSMSAGKTLSGRVIVHLLSQLGLRVAGAKLTGAARYRDVLSFKDAGAVTVMDFVDAGLPSTVCDEGCYRQALAYLMNRLAESEPDVIVAEAGASPLEPYNGQVAIDALGSRIRFELLCAQDPYAVVGVQSAFARRPDLVAGGAANTSAGIALVRELTGLPALNLADAQAHQTLAKMLVAALSPGASA